MISSGHRTYGGKTGQLGEGTSIVAHIRRASIRVRSVLRCLIAPVLPKETAHYLRSYSDKMNFGKQEMNEDAPYCHPLVHSGHDDDLRPHSVPVPCCYIGDDLDDEIEVQLPQLRGHTIDSSMIDLVKKASCMDEHGEISPSMQDRSALGIDEGIGSELTSVYAGISPPVLTPQTSVEPNTISPDHGGSGVVNAKLRKILENIAEHDHIPTPGEIGLPGCNRQSSEDDLGSQQRSTKRRPQPPQPSDSPDQSPESASPIISTYDWPMTTTEKLMSKYSYKNELGQFTKRMDNVFSLFTSGQRDTILQGLRAMHQVSRALRTRNA